MNGQLLFLFLLIFFSCNSSELEKTAFEQAPSSIEALADHSKEFSEPEVLTVTEGVHVAIGFGLANSILIEGEDGDIIVDCMESDGAATRVKAEFEKFSQLFKNLFQV